MSKANLIVAVLLENWTPRPQDIAWTKAHLERINDGGFWGTSECLYRVDKTNKILRVMDGQPGEMFKRIKACCAAMGWRCLLPGEGDDEKSFSM